MSDTLINRNLLSEDWWAQRLGERNGSDRGMAEFVVEKIAELTLALTGRDDQAPTLAEVNATLAATEQWWVDRFILAHLSDPRGREASRQMTARANEVGPSGMATRETCGFVDANGGPCIMPKGHPGDQHADEDYGQLRPKA